MEHFKLYYQIKFKAEFYIEFEVGKQKLFLEKGKSFYLSTISMLSLKRTLRVRQKKCLFFN